MPKLTKERLLKEATQHAIFVHRYRESHEKRRKFARRLCKDGLLTMLGQNNEGWLYRAATQPSKE